MSKTETIEEKTYRLLQIANKNDEGVAIDSDFEGEMFNSLLDNTIFKLHCKMIELAIAEERENCIKVAEEWFEEITDYDIRTYITQRRAPKDEVSE